MNKQPRSKEDQTLPHRLVIAGRSDDLVEVYGDIRLERSQPTDRDFRFKFSDGTSLNLYWGDGGWKVDVTEEGEGSVTHYPAGEYIGTESINQYDEAVKILADQEWLQINGTRLDFTDGIEDFYRPALR